MPTTFRKVERVRASRRMRNERRVRLMLRDASQRDSAVEGSALLSRCDAPQHEGEGARCILANEPKPLSRPRASGDP
jgi:hypothetical protein